MKRLPNRGLTLVVWAWCVLFGTALPAWASCGDQPPATLVPVLVLGVDDKSESLSRQNHIFTRVLGEMNASMARCGFRMLDEAMLISDMNWKISGRQGVEPLIQISSLANAKGDARTNHRALVTFSIFASQRSLGHATEMHTRIEGEIRDALTRQFKDRFEFQATYPGPADCNEWCINKTIGDRAAEIAMNLGDVLGKKLAFLQPQPATTSKAVASPAVITGNPAQSPCPSAPSAATHTMMTTYGVTFRRFNNAEILSIMGVMTTEFPGFAAVNIIELTPAVRKYDYVSSATAAKLVEWMHILLLDMRLSDRNVTIQVEGNQITLDKITPTPDATSNRKEERFK
ncbi:hypothetical protein SIID45300_02246 [Candidatus Magnetaquicoccaceae bacterium FCR-1]|uniref:Uncharacterized protein n=1 Tax=Candidatus Magnetaquiglobus chichijimensis TaxID=3141448 RepID=A0ABQ0CAK1_9PROT